MGHSRHRRQLDIQYRTTAAPIDHRHACPAADHRIGAAVALSTDTRHPLPRGPESTTSSSTTTTFISIFSFASTPACTSVRSCGGVSGHTSMPRSISLCYPSSHVVMTSFICFICARRRGSEQGGGGGGGGGHTDYKGFTRHTFLDAVFIIIACRIRIA